MKNLGAKLFKKNSKKILGGNMLLSKNPNMILPDYWPSYYKKSKHTSVWDLSGKKYLDMIQNKYISTLLTLTKKELSKGLEEINLKYKKKIEFKDKLICLIL